MSVAIIGDYEVTYSHSADPALVIHHVVRGYDAVTLDGAAAAELGELLTVAQKRIRELGGYQALFGAGGDLALYTAGGQRACYLTPEQARQLSQLLAG